MKNWYFNRGWKTVGSIAKYVLYGVLAYGIFKESPERPSLDFNIYILAAIIFLCSFIGIIYHEVLEYNERDKNLYN